MANELGNEVSDSGSHITQEQDPTDINPDVSEEDVTGLKLIRQFDFHFLMWAYILCASLQLTFQVMVY